ncbi:MAG: AraC family transcriptional regulator [Clostridia bacterium]|nr:AraC family transcriptional regulator [Clostridia bacterium]
MDWLTGLQRAIDYVEDHLTEEIDYDRVAGEVACSGFYFQRIFGMLCSMTLGEYIRNRRLTLAGNDLRAGNAKVIDVALRYGYESPESFARAFSRFHGISPSEAKKEGAKLRSFSRISVKITVSGGTVMDYKIVEKQAFTILEKAGTHTVENAENAKSIPDFWARSHRDGTVDQLMERTSEKTYLFGVCYGTSSEDAKTFEYAIAARCDGETEVPEGFRIRTIPARTWAVFPCRGAMPDAIQNMWHRIVSEFFPTSDYQPTMELDIEAYTQGDMEAPDYQSEIWVPVTKKTL